MPDRVDPPPVWSYPVAELSPRRFWWQDERHRLQVVPSYPYRGRRVCSYSVQVLKLKPGREPGRLVWAGSCGWVATVYVKGVPPFGRRNGLTRRRANYLAHRIARDPAVLDRRPLPPGVSDERAEPEPPEPEPVRILSASEAAAMGPLPQFEILNGRMYPLDDAAEAKATEWARQFGGPKLAALKRRRKGTRHA